MNKIAIILLASLIFCKTGSDIVLDAEIKPVDNNYIIERYQNRYPEASTFIQHIIFNIGNTRMDFSVYKALRNNSDYRALFLNEMGIKMLDIIMVDNNFSILLNIINAVWDSFSLCI